MVQTKYRILLSTSKKQWEELAVMDDGRMILYFHGRDRSVTQQVTAITEGEWAGWLRSEKGSMWPGLKSGRWNKMDDVVETTDCADLTDVEPVVIEETTDCTDCTDDEPLTMNPKPLTMNPKPLTIEQPRPRRQRKQRKPRVERQEPAISHQPSAIRHQTSSTMKAVGMVAAATVALFVIYETGLLIPLGLIGLATGGILK